MYYKLPDTNAKFEIKIMPRRYGEIVAKEKYYWKKIKECYKYYHETGVLDEQTKDYLTKWYFYSEILNEMGDII